MQLANLDIRLRMTSQGILLKQLAIEVGMNADYLSRILGGQLSERQRIKIIDALERLEKRGRGN